MRIGKFQFWHRLATGWLCLVLASAQAQASPQAPVPSTAAPIVVTAPTPLAPGEKPSDWKRADSPHLIVYSNGSEDQLRRVNEHLERLHALLARLYGSADPGREPAPLEVVLFDSADAMRKLNLHDPGVSEGPFARSFAGQRYYDPRPDGSVLALARVDQVVPMDTSLAHDADCADLAEDGVDCLDARRPTFHPPVTRPWEEVLYGAYAQHMVLHYASARYPRWYVDGIGAVFSTVVFRSDGAIEYGRPPEGYRAVLRSYGRLDAASVLNGDYLNAPSQRMDWTPYHAWLLTHFFVLSNLKGPERAQFAAYMTAIARGRPMAEAARAFGRMTRLARAVAGYAERPHDFATTEKAGAEPPPTVAPLSRPAADALMASLASPA